jgi:tetratricopeptide (TPR) repeat protein
VCSYDLKQMSANISRILGLIHIRLGMLAKAIRYHTMSMQIHEDLNDRLGMAKDYNNIGLVYSDMGNYKEALKSFSDALTILQELEKETGYHYPLIEKIQDKISSLKPDDK